MCKHTGDTSSSFSRVLAARVFFRGRRVDYYIAFGQQRLGPFTFEQLATRELRPDTLVWCEVMPEWAPASSVPELIPLLPQQSGAAPAIAYAAPGNAMVPPFIPGQGNRVIAGIFGILLGAFGVHKFIAGLNTGGVIMLCTTIGSFFVSGFCCMLAFAPLVMAIIGVIEGIMYLCCTDEEFYFKYVVQKRQWF